MATKCVWLACALLAAVSVNSASVGGWLEAVKPGYDAKYGASFVGIGIEDTSDFGDIDSAVWEDLEAALSAAGAKALQLKKIKAAIDEAKTSEPTASEPTAQTESTSKAKGGWVGGEKCGLNSQCETKQCGRMSADEDAELRCCPPGIESKPHKLNGLDYCNGMPRGTVCLSGAMCADGTCRHNARGLERGVCGLGESNDRCGLDVDCKNEQCGRLSADEGVVIMHCCPPGSSSSAFLGKDYCNKMKGGTACRSDAQCISDSCKGNGAGFKIGECLYSKSEL
jgi:hypothetical protein